MPGVGRGDASRSTSEAGFPADAYINIYATNEQIESVIADPRVRGVSLTGSERAGAAVAEIAGRNLKKVVLELGGSDPFILLSTDDLDDGGRERGRGARRQHRPVLQRGQALHRRRRALRAVPGEVHRRDHRGRAGRPDQVGDRDRPAVVLDWRPSGSRTRCGARSTSGAKLVAGGDHEGNFFKTTVLTDIGPDNPARHEEFFGPVARSTASGPRRRRSSSPTTRPYGLGSYVMTTDAEQARRVAEKIEAGMVFVNLVGADGAELPFGGVKRSGFGRELGRYGIDEFVNKKLIRIGG